jgi:NAD(P)-dependent dehydrogenase (short-subunit alcohol dehydrogenase family)
MDTQTKKTSTSDLSGNTTIVIGASRGLGREIARAFADAGAPVVADADATRRWRGACWTSTSRRYSSLSPAPTR